jgi:universal protein Kae1
MICLGIESTAHSFGVGIIDDKGRVLANLWDMYRPPQGWGIEPMKAAQHHREVSGPLLDKALKQAGLQLSDIGLVSFSQGPGLPPCLHAGLEFAKSLDRPLIGVNHCIAHIEIGRLKTSLQDPVTLYVSGANTQVLAFTEGRYRCFGETMDVGIGNALDKFGRETGMGFPAGPRIEELAKRGAENYRRRVDKGGEAPYLELPYVVKGMDLSFSGIITSALQKFNKGEKLEDLCFSIQETLFAMLTEVTERALAHTGKNEALLTGGVAANSRLQAMLDTMCRERRARFSVVPREFSGDNGLMIAWAGILAHKSGQRPLDPGRADILPRQRTDEVEVGWIK